MMDQVFKLLSAVLLLAACAGTDERIVQLDRQLRERDLEIADLRKQLETAQQNRAPPVADNVPVSSPEISESGDEDAEEMSRALERTLVRQGGLVLPEKTIEIEPEVSYYYSEPNGGPRRDTFISALSFRLGLPWAMQADLRVPYVLHDRQTGIGSATGLGDIEVGLAKRLIAEQEYLPELLLTGRWKPPTGSSGGVLPTGTGNHALQAELTASKRQDPLVILGGLRYTKNLQSGERDLGDAVGGRLGVILAATPDTSVLLEVNVSSSFGSRIGGQSIAETDHLAGIVEFDVATVLAKDTLLNIITGIGFTPAAPDFRLTVSLPTRF